MTTPPKLPPHVLDNIEAYRTASSTCRFLLMVDGASISSLWTNLTVAEQMAAVIAMGNLVNELIADHYVSAGMFPRGGVPLAAIAEHHQTFLDRLAGAFDQPTTGTGEQGPQ